MNNSKRVLTCLIIFFSMICSFTTSAVNFENDFVSPATKPQIIKEIYTLANIDKNGDMEITQKWIFNDKNTNGTEHYIPFSKGNLKGAQLSNIKVSQNGKDLKQKPWDIDEDFNSKIGYYGVNDNDNNLEICFGIGEKRDNNEFIVRYKIFNALERSEDNYTFLNWKFINDNLSDKVAKVRVEVKLPVLPEKIYGFGYKGYVFVKDNDSKTVVYENKGDTPLDSGNYLVSLIELQDGLGTNVGRRLGRDRNSIYKESFKGSFYKEEYLNKKSNLITENMVKSGNVDTQVKDPKKNIMSFGKIFNLVTSGIFPIMFIVIFLKGIIPNIKFMNMRSKFSNEIEKDDIEEYYFRDNVEIPPERFVLPLELEDMIDPCYLMMYFITKWVNEDIVRVKRTEEKKLFWYKDSMSLVLIGTNNRKMEDLELMFYTFLGMYTDRYYEISAKTISNKMDWEYISRKLELYIHDIFENPEEISRHYYSVDSNGSKKDKILKPNEVEVLKHYYGLKNFLEDFTLMNEREVQEVKIWDYHMEMAAFFGIAEEVQDQLKMYPQVYQGDTSYLESSRLVTSVVYPIMDSGFRESSSGSGGSSSSGGGGGSSGGGSGGGTR